MSNLPPGTTQGMADRAAWDYDDELRCVCEDCCPSCGCTSDSQDQHYAHCAYAGATDEDLMGRYEPGSELSATINVGPLDVAAMQAALERLKAPLTDDDRAAVSAVITVEEPR